MNENDFHYEGEGVLLIIVCKESSCIYRDTAVLFFIDLLVPLTGTEKITPYDRLLPVINNIKWLISNNSVRILLIRQTSSSTTFDQYLAVQVAQCSITRRVIRIIAGLSNQLVSKFWIPSCGDSVSNTICSTNIQTVETFMNRLVSSVVFFSLQPICGMINDIQHWECCFERAGTLDLERRMQLAHSDCSKLVQSKQIRQNNHVAYQHQDDTWAKFRVNRWTKITTQNIKYAFYTMLYDRLKLLKTRTKWHRGLHRSPAISVINTRFFFLYQPSSFFFFFFVIIEQETPFNDQRHVKFRKFLQRRYRSRLQRLYRLTCRSSTSRSPIWL